LNLKVTNTGAANSYTYRTFDSTSSYLIAAGDQLEFGVFMDAANPEFLGGFDAVLSTSGTVRDNSGWVDQNSISIHLDKAWRPKPRGAGITGYSASGIRPGRYSRISRLCMSATWREAIRSNWIAFAS